MHVYKGMDVGMWVYVRVCAQACGVVFVPGQGRSCLRGCGRPHPF